jgi:hypothetical protein
MKPDFTKKCRTCVNRSKVEIDGFATCKVWKHDVWLESLACCEYDDTEPF